MDLMELLMEDQKSRLKVTLPRIPLFEPGKAKRDDEPKETPQLKLPLQDPDDDGGKSGGGGWEFGD